MKEVKSSQSFVSMAESLRCVDGDTDTAGNADTELWLVQVPLGFQVSALNKLDSSVLGVSGGTQTLKVKTDQENKVFYSVTAFRDSEKCQKMSTVVTGTSGQVSLGGDVRNMLIVTEAAEHSAWHADGTLPAQRTPVPMPEGLKMRYTPFGAGTPCPSVSGKSKKKKKHALKAKESVEELDGVGHDSRKSKKKRKREASPDPDQEPSPKKKKSKHRHSQSIQSENSKHRHSQSIQSENSKRRHSQSIQSQSVDGQGPEKTPERRRSKSQRRRSEGAVKDSAGDGQVFVIDRVGHPHFTAEDEAEIHHNRTDSNTKHKKSKKEKKHRKTM